MLRLLQNKTPPTTALMPDQFRTLKELYRHLLNLTLLECHHIAHAAVQHHDSQGWNRGFAVYPNKYWNHDDKVPRTAEQARQEARRGENRPKESRVIYFNTKRSISREQQRELRPGTLIRLACRKGVKSYTNKKCARSDVGTLFCMLVSFDRGLLKMEAINMTAELSSLKFATPLASFISQQRQYYTCQRRPKPPFFHQLVAMPFPTHIRFDAVGQTTAVVTPEEAPGGASASTGLNSSQRAAVERFVKTVDEIYCEDTYKPIYGGMQLLQGPPGTGKTQTIVALLLRLLDVGPQHRGCSFRRRVVCCASSNKAVSVVLEGLLAQLPSSEAIDIVEAHGERQDCNATTTDRTGAATVSSLDSKASSLEETSPSVDARGLNSPTLLCAGRCNIVKSEADFSPNQWLKGLGRAKCLECVSAEQRMFRHKQQQQERDACRSHPTPKPPATSVESSPVCVILVGVEDMIHPNLRVATPTYAFVHSIVPTCLDMARRATSCSNGLQVNAQLTSLRQLLLSHAPKCFSKMTPLRDALDAATSGERSKSQCAVVLAEAEQVCIGLCRKYCTTRHIIANQM